MKKWMNTKAKRTIATVLAFVMVAALMPNITMNKASAAKSLEHIEKLKTNGGTFNVLEIVNNYGEGNFSYLVDQSVLGEEADWAKAIKQAGADADNGEAAQKLRENKLDEIIKRLESQQALGAVGTNTHPLTKTDAEAKVYLPWEYGNASENALTINLDEKEMQNVPGTMEEKPNVGSYDKSVTEEEFVKDGGGNALQNIDHFEKATQTEVGKYYYKTPEFKQLKQEKDKDVWEPKLKELISKQANGKMAVYAKVKPIQGSDKVEYIHRDFDGKEYTAKYDQATNSYSNFTEINTSDSTIYLRYEGTLDATLGEFTVRNNVDKDTAKQDSDKEYFRVSYYYVDLSMTALKGMKPSATYDATNCYYAVTDELTPYLTDGVDKNGYFNVDADGFTYVGPGEGNWEFKYDPNSDKEYMLHYKQVRVDPGFTSNQWLLRESFNVEDLTTSKLKINVKTVDAKTLTYADVTQSDTRLIYINKGIGNTPKFQFTQDTFNGLRDAKSFSIIVEGASGYSGKNTDIANLVMHAVKNHNAPINKAQNKNYNNDGSVYEYSYLVGNGENLLSQDYKNKKLSGNASFWNGSAWVDGDGYKEVTAKIKEVNDLRTLDKDKLPTDITPATCVRHVINYLSARVVNKKTSLKVLAVEPYKNDTKLTAADVKKWIPNATAISEQNIEIDKMSMNRFVSTIKDINSTYDLVYFGDSKEGQVPNTAKNDLVYEQYINDITDTKTQELKDFLDSGFPIVFADSLVGKGPATAEAEATVNSSGLATAILSGAYPTGYSWRNSKDEEVGTERTFNLATSTDAEDTYKCVITFKFKGQEKTIETNPVKLATFKVTPQSNGAQNTVGYIPIYLTIENTKYNGNNYSKATIVNNLVNTPIYSNSNVWWWWQDWSSNRKLLSQYGGTTYNLDDSHRGVAYLDYSTWYNTCIHAILPLDNNKNIKFLTPEYKMVDIGRIWYSGDQYEINNIASGTTIVRDGTASATIESASGSNAFVLSGKLSWKSSKGNYTSGLANAVAHKWTKDGVQVSTSATLSANQAGTYQYTATIRGGGKPGGTTVDSTVVSQQVVIEEGKGDNTIKVYAATGTPKTLDLDKTAVYTVAQKNKIAENSNFYKAVKSFAMDEEGNPRSNLFKKDELDKNTDDKQDDMLRAINMGSPKLEGFTGPEEYKSDLEKDLLSNNTMTFSFTVKNETDAFPESTSYEVALYIDQNGDGRFVESERQNNLSISGAEPDGTIKGAKQYTVMRTLPRSADGASTISGALPWELRVTNVNNPSQRAVETGITYKKPSAPVSIKILQIRPDTGNGAGFNLASSNGNPKSGNTANAMSEYGQYFKELYDKKVYSIDIDSVTIGAFNSDKHKNLGQYNMLLLGFGDSYGNESNNKGLNAEASQAVLNFINEGKAVLFTHDTTADIGHPNQQAFTTFRSRLGMLDQGLKGKGNSVPIYRYPNNGFNNENRGTTSANRINEGQISSYPYAINKDITIASTHYQWFQVDVNDPEVNVWYTLGGGGEEIYEKYHKYDGVNAYYIYNKGNITYSGAGHSAASNGNQGSPNNWFTDDERKLFVNTMVAAYRAAQTDASVSFVDEQDNTRNTQMLFMNDGKLMDGQNIYFKPINDTVAAANARITYKIFQENSVGSGSISADGQLQGVTQRDGLTVRAKGTNVSVTNGQLAAGIVYYITVDELKTKGYITDQQIKDNNIPKLYIQITVTTTAGNKSTKTYAADMTLKTSSLLTLR